ncbi:MAG: hypothetical protein AAGB25_00955 [Pseudomonadota bacterium]
MTGTQAAPDLFARISFYAKRLTSWAARAGFGVFVVAAAGVALLATTLLGLFLALAALFLKAAHSFGRGGGRSNANPRGGASARPDRRPVGDTLDATQTPDGWVIDPQAPKHS